MELLFYPSIFVICSALLHISVYCSMKLILSLWYSVAHHSYQSKVGAKSDQHIQSRRDTKNNYMPDCGTTIVPTTKTLSDIGGHCVQSRMRNVCRLRLQLNWGRWLPK
eukprot:245290_1